MSVAKTPDAYELAARAIFEEGLRIRKSAAKFNLCHVSLLRFLNKMKNQPPLVVHAKPKSIFTPEEEDIIIAQLLECADIFYGLLPVDVKRLVYQCAVDIGVTDLPPAWVKNGMVGVDWYKPFMARNPGLLLRSPEAFLSRESSFNRSNVAAFFQKYAAIQQKYKIPPSCIWNVDEIGITTVQKPNQFGEFHGPMQGAVPDNERGTLVTLACAVSATGASIPLVFVFPRFRTSSLAIRHGPLHCIGMTNSTGRMTVTSFSKFMDHFIKYAKPSEQYPVLIILDNNSTHVSTQVIKKAKENHIILLSFPPNCSHKLQPLEVEVYGPFKTYVNRSQLSWTAKYPSKTMTVNDIPAIVKKILPRAMNPKNIINGFRVTGIWPYNSKIFPDYYYGPGVVTDALESADSVTNKNNSLQREEDLTKTPEDSDLKQSDPPLDSTEVIAQQTSKNKITEPVAGPSGTQYYSIVFAPSPFGPGQNCGRGLKRKCNAPKKSSLLDEFEELLQKEKELTQKEKYKGKARGRGKGKEIAYTHVKDRIDAMSKRILYGETELEVEEFCMVCGEDYTKLDGETWIECVTCRLWSHVRCVKGDPLSYLCLYCDSDED